MSATSQTSEEWQSAGEGDRSREEVKGGDEFRLTSLSFSTASKALLLLGAPPPPPLELAPPPPLDPNSLLNMAPGGSFPSLAPSKIYSLSKRAAVSVAPGM